MAQEGEGRLWKRYAAPDRQGSVVLWVNPRMKQCAFAGPLGAECAFADVDADLIMEHFSRQHTLEGREQTREDKQVGILQALPNEDVQCPFCFERQKSRATRFFLDDGALSRMVRCYSCKRTMRSDSMRAIRPGWRDFGRWVGGYPRFWQGVDHDGWVEALKREANRNDPNRWSTSDDAPSNMTLFWMGYGDSRPDFREKQRIAKAAREYEKEGPQPKQEGTLE